MGILLTLEGMKEAGIEVDAESYEAIFIPTLSAQVKRVAEWGEEVCMPHGMRKRRRCDKCWQQLLKEAGL